MQQLAGVKDQALSLVLPVLHSGAKHQSGSIVPWPAPAYTGDMGTMGFRAGCWGEEERGSQPAPEKLHFTDEFLICK